MRPGTGCRQPGGRAGHSAGDAKIPGARYPGRAPARPSRNGLEEDEGTISVASNLTRDEAHDRRRLVDVCSYHVDLDLTGDDDVFTSQTTVTFGSRPGASTFIDLTA